MNKDSERIEDVDKENFSEKFKQYMQNLCKYDKLDRDAVNEMRVKGEHMLKGSPSIHTLKDIDYINSLEMKVNICFE